MKGYIRIFAFLFLLTGALSIGYYLKLQPKTISRKEHLLWQCNIADLEGNLIKKYPCGQCLFRDNGEMVMQCHNDKLSYFSKTGELLWETPLHVHHMFNWNELQTEILVLSSEVAQEHGNSIRYDVLVVLDTAGKVKHRFSFLENKEVIDNELRADPRSAEAIGETDENIFKDVPAQLEASHANSFYEIAENALKNVHPAFRPGNYIVNVNHLKRIFILDKHLKKILFSIRLPYRHNVHDAQITPEGRLLVFNNRPFADDERASIELWDPINGKLLTRYLGDSEQPFISHSQGGVRLLKNKKIIFSNNAGQIFYLDENMKLRRSMKVKFVSNSLQGIDVRDISGFLKENQTL